jgi:hypothetical protein
MKGIGGSEPGTSLMRTFAMLVTPKVDERGPES